MNEVSAIGQRSAVRRRQRGGWGLAALVGLLYVAAGWIGLHLAVRPEETASMWPAAGLAMGAVLLYGRFAMLGVIAGSTILGLLMLDDVRAPLAIAAALGIAHGAALQALVGTLLLRRVFGRPLRLAGVRDAILFAVFAGPLSCTVAAGVGVGILWMQGAPATADFGAMWLTWWLGDLLGMLVIMPLVLLNPWRRATSLYWRGRPATGLSKGALGVVLITFGLTIYAWTLANTSTHRTNQAAFGDMAKDSARALTNRMESYLRSLDGGAGLFHAAGRVDLEGWRRYVDTLDIRETLPGINGIGLIVPLIREGRQGFLEEAAALGVDDLTIHPETGADTVFPIIYIEPLDANSQAVGLDIAFEANRFEAATTARDTGEATITRRIFLVQDSTRSAGFLLLRPFYRGGAAPESPAARRDAFIGWVYAPFIGNRLLADLTAHQGKSFTFSVFDGPTADPSSLIYATPAEERAALYSKTETLLVMGKTWTLQWQSTPQLERAMARHEPALLLGGGCALSLLIGSLMISSARREATISELVELKTGELTTRENETRSIVKTAAVGIVLLDSEGSVLSANEAAGQMFDRPANALPGRLIYELIGSLTPGGLGRLLSVQDPRNQDPSDRLVLENCSSVEDLALEVHAQSWLTDDGGERITLILRDVTLELRAARELRVSEERWDTALKSGGIGVFDIDVRRGRFVTSETWREMLGFPARSIVGRDAWLLLIHPDDLDQVADAERDCIEGRADRAISEYRIRHARNAWVWMRSDAVVIKRGADGRALRIVGTQIDITALKDATEALKTSEEHLRSAMEHAPIGMALEAVDGSWLEVNAALANFLGYSKEELSALGVTRLMHGEERDDDAGMTKRLLAGQIETYQLERRFERKDGRIVWGLLCRSLTRTSDAKPDCFVSQIQDIDEQKAVERLKSDFISTVSHELRTPLTSIRGALGLLGGPGSPQTATRHERLLTIARTNCERLILLVNDILDLEKLASGEMRYRAERRDVVALVERCVVANQAYADGFRVALVHAEGSAECYARLDPNRFEQVMANLISNAVKFSPKDGEIRISVKTEGREIRVTVADDGPGVPVEFRNEVFERFSQADSSSTRAKGGTGLGLHISKEIIEYMGGQIGFDSVPGGGATFWITVPIMGDEGAKNGHAMATEVSGTRPVILHVEDDRGFAELLALSLQDCADVVTAFGCEEGFARLSERDFDLVIIDWELPDGHGSRLLDAPRLTHSGAPVIGLSANELGTHDGRVLRQFVKSRTSHNKVIEAVKRIVAGVTAQRSEPRSSGAGGAARTAS